VFIGQSQNGKEIRNHFVSLVESYCICCEIEDWIAYNPRMNVYNKLVNPKPTQDFVVSITFAKKLAIS
jgi:hypothetical protein